MSYLETIKRLLVHIKLNSEIPKEEKDKAEKLLSEVAFLLALY